MATHLSKLPEVERLGSCMIRVLGGNPGKFTLQGTNTYIIGSGPSRLLIDTGEGRPSWIKAVKDVLSKERAVISQAVITHWHGDHTGGIASLLEAFPNTEIYKNQPGEGQLNIEDGQRFLVQGATLRAVYTPGHTQDHMAFIFEEEGSMFTGDNVLGHGTAVFEDLPTYLTSLDRMGRLFTGKAYPGHGPVIADGKGKLLEYIQHRQQREDQVLQVLKSSKRPLGDDATCQEADAWTAMEIVKIIYKDVPSELHLPAHGGIMQVLWKLQKEDEVFEDGSSQKWTIKGRAAL